MGGCGEPGDSYDDDPERGKSTAEENDDRAEDLEDELSDSLDDNNGGGTAGVPGADAGNRDTPSEANQDARGELESELADDSQLFSTEFPSDDVRERLINLYAANEVSADAVERAAAHYQTLDPSEISDALIDDHEFDLGDITADDLRETFDWILEDDELAATWVETIARVDRLKPVRRDSATPGAVEQGLVYAADVRENGHEIVGFKIGRDAEEDQGDWEDALGSPDERADDPDIVETAVVVDFRIATEDEFARVYEPSKNKFGRYLMRFSAIRGRDKEAILDAFAIDEDHWTPEYTHLEKVVPSVGTLIRLSPSAGFISQHPKRNTLRGSGRQYRLETRIDQDRWLEVGTLERVLANPNLFVETEYPDD